MSSFEDFMRRYEREQAVAVPPVQAQSAPPATSKGFGAFLDKVGEQSSKRAALAVDTYRDRGLDEAAAAEDMARLWKLKNGTALPASAFIGSELVKTVGAEDSKAILREAPKPLLDWVNNDPINAIIARADAQNLSLIGGLLHGAGRTTETLGRTALPSTLQAVANKRYEAAATAIEDRDRSYLDILKEEATENLDAKMLGGAFGIEVPSYFNRVLGVVTAPIDAAGRKAAAAMSDPAEDAEVLDARKGWAMERTRIANEVNADIAANWGDSRLAARVRPGVEKAKNEEGFAAQTVAFARLLADDPAGMAAFILQTTAESIPAMVVAAPVSRLVSPAAGAAVMAASSAVRAQAQSFEQVAKSRGYDLSNPEDNIRLFKDPAVVGELTDASVRYTAAVSFFDAVSGGVAGKQLANTVLGDIILQGIAQGGLGGIGEAAGLFLSGQPVNAVDVILEIVSEFTSGPVEALTVGGRRLGQARRAAAEVRNDRSFFDALAANVENSEARAKLPEKYKEALSSMTKDGPVETLYIDANRLDELMQSGKVDPEQLTALTGLTPEQVATAAAVGGDVQIETATFGAHVVGTPLDKPLREHLRTDPARASAAEWKELQKASEDPDARAQAQALADTVAAEQQALAQEFEAERERMAAELEAIGQPREAAQYYALQNAAFAQTMATRLNMAPAAFMRRFKLPVFQADPATAAAARGPALSQQETAFQQWFGNSAVKNDRGEPLVVYHGSDTAIQGYPAFAFKTGRPGKRYVGFAEVDTVSSGLFFSPSRADAKNYGSSVDAYYLSVQRPLGDPRLAVSSSRATPEERAASAALWDDIAYIFAPVTEGDPNDVWSISTNGGVSTADGVGIEAFVEAIFGRTAARGEQTNAIEWHHLDNPEVVARMRERGYDGALVEEPMDESGLSWFVLDPTQVKSVNNRGSFDPNDPRVLFQSVTLRRGTERLDEYGLTNLKNPKGGKRKPTTREVAAALEARQRAKYGPISQKDFSEKAKGQIADWMTEEIMYEVELAVKTPGKSAVGWYTTKLQSAINALGETFPELVGRPVDAAALPGVARFGGNPQHARDFFVAILAITSDGAKVKENFRSAVGIYANWRETATLDNAAGIGNIRDSYPANLALLTRYVDEHGFDALRGALLEELTVKELKKIAKDAGVSLGSASKMAADMRVPYAAVVFGPKLGAFYANLMGQTGYLTMDRWWSRTFNRYRGHLLAVPSAAGIARVRQLMIDAGHDPATVETDDQLLSAIVPVYDKYMARKRANPSELEKAVNTLYKAAFLELQDIPAGARDRRFMHDTTLEAQRRLRERGVDMTIADIQAVLWYYEKRLYSKLGARATADISYEEAARRAADEYASRSERPADEDAGGPGEPAEADDDGVFLNLSDDGAYQLWSDARELAGFDTDAQPDVLTDVPFGDELYQSGAPGPSIQDFEERMSADLLKQDGWYVVTGIKEAVGDWDHPQNLASNANLRRMLDERGVEYMVVKGMYDGVFQGESFLVIDDINTGLNLGRAFGQESILTHRGLEYSDGRPNTPAVHDETVVGPGAKDKGFYSENPDGTVWSLGLNFGDTLNQGPVPGMTPTMRPEVVLGTDLEGDGLSFAQFFDDVTSGVSQQPTNLDSYKPVVEVTPEMEEFAADRAKFSGRFEAHIQTSIPGYREMQDAVGVAVTKVLSETGGAVLDIGASEGAMVKAAVQRAGKGTAVALDPNHGMERTFNEKPQVEGVEFAMAAFGDINDAGKLAWTEDDGTEVPFFDPGEQRFDIVHEAMVFQFIHNGRNAQVAAAKQFMKPDGLFLTFEKFAGPGEEYRANEEKKDAYKAQYYSAEQLADKAKRVLQQGGDSIEGMTNTQVSYEEMEFILRRNFAHVAQVWSSGNFRGYAASDDPAALQRFTDALPSLDSEYATVPTPRVLPPLPAGETLFQSAPANLYVSPLLERVREAKQAKAKGKDWLAILPKLPGVKEAELVFTGVMDWLDGVKDDTVTREELTAFITANQIDLVELEGGKALGNVIDDSIPRNVAMANPIYAVARDRAIASRLADLFDDPSAAEPESRAGAAQWIDANWRLWMPQETTYTSRFDRSRSVTAYSFPYDGEYQLGDRVFSREQVVSGELDRAIDAALFPEGPPRDTKWGSYTEEGGEDANYREFLLTVPRLHEAPINEGKRPFVYSTHYSDENIVVTMRTTDRDISGKRTLFAEEVQSDLASNHRKEGSTWRNATPEGKAAVEARYQDTARAYTAASERYAAAMIAESGRPADEVNSFVAWVARAAVHIKNNRPSYDAPTPSATDLELTKYTKDVDQQLYDDLVEARDAFDKATTALSGTGKFSYEPFTPFEGAAAYELAAKRLLQRAAREGYEALGWTPGWMQARRWDAAGSSVVERVMWVDGQEGTDWDGGPATGKIVQLNMMGGNTVSTVYVGDDGVIWKQQQGAKEWIGEQLSGLIGNLATEVLGTERGDVDGAKITFPSSGYAVAYDRQIKGAVEKIAKKYGAKVTAGEFAEVRSHEAYAVEASSLMRQQKPPQEVMDALEFSETDRELVATVMETLRGAAEIEIDRRDARRIRDAEERLAEVKRQDEEAGLPETSRTVRIAENILAKVREEVAADRDADIDWVFRAKMSANPTYEGAIIRALKKRGATAVEVWQVEINDAMRAALSEPFPLFQGNRASIVLPPNADAPPVITVFAGNEKDRSSVIHESAHWFLHVLERSVVEGLAPQPMVDDWNTLRSWWRSNAQAIATEVGVDTGAVYRYLDGEQLDITTGKAVWRGLHEQFARGFEAYAMEGKAPSVGLRAAFASFGAWLKALYRSAVGLNVDISDDVRLVFDRLLATDEEIATAATDMGLDREAAAKMGVPPKELDALAALALEAQEEARAYLQGVSAGALRTAKRLEYREARAKALADATAAVNADPAHKAVMWLRKGQWIDLNEARPEALPVAKLDRAIIADDYDDETVTTLRPFLQDGGVDPDDVAGFFGYSSGDALVQALKVTPDADRAIRQRVLNAMRQQFGDGSEVRGRGREAIVQGDKYGQLLDAELRALQKAAPSTGIGHLTRRQAAIMAEQSIDSMAARAAIRSETFLNGERRAGRRVEEALQKGDIAKALQHKREQIFQHALYRASKDAAETVEKTRAKAKRLASSGTRKNLANEYLEAIDQVLETYDFRKLPRGAEINRERLKAYVDMMEATGRAGELAIPDHVLNEANRRPYLTLSMAELKGVRATLTNIEHTARLKQKLRTAQEERDLREVVDGVVAELDAHLPDRPQSRVRTRSERAYDALRTYANLGLNVETRLRQYAGWAYGAAYAAIKKDVDAAGVLEETMRREADIEIARLYSMFDKKTRRAMSRARKHSALGGDFTRWQLISAALNMGNEANLSRLKGADTKFPMTDAQIDYIRNELTGVEWDFVEGVWAMIDSYWPQIAARERRRTGVVPTKVQPTPFDLPSGRTISGGYYPIKYDGELTAVVEPEQFQEQLRMMQAGKFGKAQTRQGHLKERTGSGGRVLALDMGVFHQHVNDVIHDLAFAEVSANVWRILQDGELAAAMDRKGLRRDRDMFEIWLQDVATGPMVGGGLFGRVAMMGKANFTMSKLAFNTSTVLLQLTGITHVIPMVGAANLARGYAVYTRNPAAALQSVLASSAFMRNRSIIFQPDVAEMKRDAGRTGDSVGSGAISDAFTKVADIGLAPLQLFQFYGVDVPAWIAAQHKALRAGATLEQAINEADRTVARTQGGTAIADRTAFERGSWSRDTRYNGFLRLWASLASYMMAKGNLAREVVGVARVKGTVEGYLSASAYLILMFSLEALIRGALKGELWDDDDDEPLLNAIGYAAKESAFAIGGTMPFVRDAVSVAQGFDGGGAYGSFASTLARPIMEMFDGELDESAVKAVSNAVGLLTGLPSSQFNRIVDGAANAGEDDASFVDYLLGVKR